MKSTTAAPGRVLVLHKALDILEAIKKRESLMGLAEISRRVRMPRPTAYRILTTLELRGYVDRTADRAYRMGSKLFSLQRDSSIEQQLQRVARLSMETIATRCKETVNLGILDSGEVVVIETVESPLAVRMSSKIGNRRLLHSTALGKALLAGMADKEISRLIRIKGLPRLTSATLVTRAALLEEVQKVRERGYAIDDQENEMDGRCIAVGISGPGDSVVAALSVSGPVFRMDRDRLISLYPELKRASEKIFRALRE